ncbi:MAG: FAD-binding and (Fe-S)-binding domain-containing protein [Oligoflexus sp.]
MIPSLNERPAIQPSYQRFLDELVRLGFSGQIGQNYADRLTQSTDNSIYQVLPQAVVYPTSQDDIAMLLSLMNRPEFSEITLVARGGGTGTNGQALTRGLVMDVSAFMNRILEVNLDEGWVRVEPGVVLDQLNQELKVHGVFFAPDLSTSNRATLGGMANTDACGKGSRIYGKTSQHILALDLVLANGEQWQTLPLSIDELEQIKGRTDRVGEIHRTIDTICKERMSLIEEKFPKLTRYLAGYNLKHVWDEHGHFNLNYLIAGSEGTLACVAGLKLKLTRIPGFKKLLLVKYDRFHDALLAARTLVAADPAAIETIDDNILQLARFDTIWHKVAKFFDGPEDENVKAINLVEFVGDDLDEINRQVQALCQRLDQERGQVGVGVGYRIAEEDGDIASLWSLRKKGVGLLGNRPGQRRPIPFVEDTVVPPEHLADYIAEFRAVLDEFGLSYGMFGHVDVGCLHVRPALDLKQEQDEKLIRIISDRVKELTLKYNGLIWGEHGKGFRGEYIPDYLGEPLHQVLRQVKTAFDPENRLNPGKLVTPLQSEQKVDRLDKVPLRAHFDRQISASVREQFAVSINCNGNGACFNFQPKDVMCPSYKQTRSRIHSPKGRAGIMREWLRQMEASGYNVLQPVKAKGRQQPTGYDFSHEVYAAMDGCLSCKACSSQCPVKVDVPDLKAKFLYHYHSRYVRPVSDLLIAAGESIHARFARTPGMARIYNFFVRQSWFQNLMRRRFGMRDTPLLSVPSFAQTAKQAGFKELDGTQDLGLSQQEKERSVILITDGVTALYEAQTVIDVLRCLQNMGYLVFHTPLWENGKPLHVKGFLNEFRGAAEKMNSRLRKIQSLGLPMVGLDPAITLTYREEYRQELADQHAGYQVHLLQEWLAAELNAGKLWQLPKLAAQVPVYRFFAHCGEQTAQPAFADQWRAIFQAFQVPFEVVPVGCCGMAGAFGHEERHYAESQGVFELSWSEPLAKAVADRSVVVATGASCRSQVERLRGQESLHPLQALGRLYLPS